MKTPEIFNRLEGKQGTELHDGINLITRKGSFRDLADCFILHESLGLPYPKGKRRVLLEMWRVLLSMGAMQLCLVEDRARPIGSRVVSFNSALFVGDKFCSEAQLTLPPYLGIELAKRYLSGQLPVLNREQVARANACDGLNVVMCFEGWIHGTLLPEQLLAMRGKQNEALHLTLRGFRIKEFLADPIGWDMSQWMLDAGARLRRNYFNYFQKHGAPKFKSLQRPWLVGLTKEEAFAHPGSNIAGLFIYTPPRFHFNRSQRVLLQRALMGETCEKLATSLSLSRWTVKKRWHAIYDRVADIDRELLPCSIAYGAYVSSRGAERRRHLLNYLRQHLEDLRP